MECYCDYDGPTVYRQTARVAARSGATRPEWFGVGRA